MSNKTTAASTDKTRTGYYIDPLGFAYTATPEVARRAEELNLTWSARIPAVIDVPPETAVEPEPDPAPEPEPDPAPEPEIPAEELLPAAAKTVSKPPKPPKAAKPSLDDELDDILGE